MQFFLSILMNVHCISGTGILNLFQFYLINKKFQTILFLKFFNWYLLKFNCLLFVGNVQKLKVLYDDLVVIYNLPYFN